MAAVLTENSNVTCGHAGSVSTSGVSKLTVNGQPALLENGIAHRTVGNCATPTASDASGRLTDEPCTLVSSVTGGAATKLKVAGQAVMLDTLTGSTNGRVGGTDPQNLLSATARQTKLSAI